jgi:hypothetical protein
MTRQETASYISHHLALAGRGSDTLFSDDAITLIHDTSRGWCSGCRGDFGDGGAGCGLVGYGVPCGADRNQ